jgi:hypothetical protein
MLCAVQLTLRERSVQVAVLADSLDSLQTALLSSDSGCCCCCACGAASTSEHSHDVRRRGGSDDGGGDGDSDGDGDDHRCNTLAGLVERIVALTAQVSQMAAVQSGATMPRGTVRQRGMIDCVVCTCGTRPY